MPQVNLPEITQGDTFGMAIWLHDESNELILPPDDPERGYVIDSTVTIEAIIKDSQGRLLANLVVEPYPNQATPPNKGWVWLSTTANTKNWPDGRAAIQVRTTITTGQKTTDIFEFNILRSLF